LTTFTLIPSIWCKSRENQSSRSRDSFAEILKPLHGSTTSKLPTEFIYNNNSVLGSKNIAETFNQYFLDIGVKLVDKIKPSTINHNGFLTGEFKNYSRTLYFYPIDASEVISVL